MPEEQPLLTLDELLEQFHQKTIELADIRYQITKDQAKVARVRSELAAIRMQIKAAKSR